MLRQLRQKKVMKKILWVLAILIIPAFVLWGAAGLRDQSNHAGMVFGKKVSFSEYREAYNAVKNRALMTYGSKFYDMQQELNLEEEAWSYIIMLKEAKRKRVNVSDNEVIARISSFGFFQNKEGAFDPKAYELILANSFRITPRQFEEEMRNSLIIEKLVRDTFASAAAPDDREIEEALSKTKEDKETKESPEERRENVKKRLAVSKKFNAYNNWYDDLYKRAGLINNLKAQEEGTEEGAEKK